MRTQSLAGVQASFSEVVNSVHATRERVTVTRNGEPVAVIISPDDLESLEETLAVLSDPEAMAALPEAEADVAHGRVTSLDVVRRDLARRRGETPRPRSGS